MMELTTLLQFWLQYSFKELCSCPYKPGQFTTFLCTTNPRGRPESVMLQNLPIMPCSSSLFFMLPKYKLTFFAKIGQEKPFLDYHSMHLLNQII